MLFFNKEVISLKSDEYTKESTYSHHYHNPERNITEIITLTRNTQKTIAREVLITPYQKISLALADSQTLLAHIL